MHPEDKKDEEDAGLPVQPEIPPFPEEEHVTPVATGQDRDAGQVQEMGQTPAPPASIAIPPLTTAAHTLDSHDYTTRQSHWPMWVASSVWPETQETPSRPADLPEVQPIDTDRDKSRAIKHASQSSPEKVTQQVVLSVANELRESQSNFLSEFVQLMERMSLTISTAQSQLQVMRAIIEDTRARQLDIERWAQSWTIPGSKMRGY